MFQAKLKPLRELTDTARRHGKAHTSKTVASHTARRLHQSHSEGCDSHSPKAVADSRRLYQSKATAPKAAAATARKLVAAKPDRLYQSHSPKAVELWQTQPENCTKATARRLWQPESCGPKTVPNPQLEDQQTVPKPHQRLSATAQTVPKLQPKAVAKPESCGRYSRRLYQKPQFEGS